MRAAETWITWVLGRAQVQGLNEIQHTSHASLFFINNFDSK